MRGVWILVGAAIACGLAAGPAGATPEAEMATVRASAPGGPWKLVSTGDGSLMLVKTGAVEPAGDGVVNGWVLTILRKGQDYKGVQIFTLESHTSARCADDAEKSLEVIIGGPNGQVLADATEGLRTEYVVHPAGTFYSEASHALCHPETTANLPGYPDEDTAIHLLMPNGPEH